jgi:hypothetical protein
LLLTENDSLRSQLSKLHGHSDGTKPDKIKKEMFDQLSLRLARNIQDLKSTHQEFISLISIS